MKAPMKPRDKITQKMTRDGLVEVNEAQQTAERISKREQDADFQKTPEQQAAQDAAAQLNPLSSGTPPHAPGLAMKPDMGTAEQVLNISTGGTPARRQKKQRGKHSRKPPHERSRPGCNSPTRNAPTRSLKRISRNPTKPPTVWTRQRRLSPKRKPLPQNAPLTKPQAGARPGFTLRKRKSPCPESPPKTRCPAPRRKRAF